MGIFNNDTYKYGAGKVLGNMGGDVMDLAGFQQKERDRQTEQQISAQNKQLNDYMAKQPGYNSIQNADGSLKNNYSLGAAQGIDQGQLDQRMGNAKDVNVADAQNSQAVIGPGQNYGQAQSNMDALQQRAFGTETSPWAQKLFDQQSLQQTGALDQMGHESALRQNQQQNNLAMQGGLEGGSRERLAKASGRDSMMARQGIFRQGQNDRLNIGINDEAQRMQLQQQMPGMNLQMDAYNTGLQQQDRQTANQMSLANMGKNMDQQQFNANLNMNKAGQWMGAEQFNAGANNQFKAMDVGNAIQNNAGQNAFNQNNWQFGGSILGGQQVADAQARQNKGTGGFLQKAFNMGGG